jgi:hypothetical protein
MSSRRHALCLGHNDRARRRAVSVPWIATRKGSQMSDVLEGTASPVDATVETPVVYPLGVSRPPLEITDLPTPEEVYGVARFGR